MKSSKMIFNGKEHICYTLDKEEIISIIAEKYSVPISNVSLTADHNYQITGEFYINGLAGY